jgi:hypothetical protein
MLWLLLVLVGAACKLWKFLARQFDHVTRKITPATAPKTATATLTPFQKSDVSIAYTTCVPIRSCNQQPHKKNAEKSHCSPKIQSTSRPRSAMLSQEPQYLRMSG